MSFLKSQSFPGGSHREVRLITSADDQLLLEHGRHYVVSLDAPFEVLLPVALGCVGQRLSVTMIGGGSGELLVTAQAGESVITTHGTQSLGGSQRRYQGLFPLQTMDLMCVDLGFTRGHLEQPRPVSTYLGSPAKPFPRFSIVALDAATLSGDDQEVLTADANGALTISGFSASAGDLVIVADPDEHDKNGYWIVADAGSGATPWVLRRWDVDYIQPNATFGTITKPWDGKESGRVYLGLGGSGNPRWMAQLDAVANFAFGHRYKREHIVLESSGGPTAIEALNPPDGDGNYELLTNGNGLMCEVRAFAHDNVTGDTANYLKVARFSRLAGVVTLKGVADISSSEDDASWDVTFDVSGDFARVLLTSDGTNTTSWIALIGWYETKDVPPP